MPSTLGPDIEEGELQLLPIRGPPVLLAAAVYLAILAVRAVRRRVIYLAAAVALGTSGVAASTLSVTTAITPHQ